MSGYDSDFMYLIKDDRLGCIEKYINRGYNINLCDESGLTPLMYASYIGNQKIVKTFLNKKAEIDSVDKKGMTALMITITAKTHLGFGLIAESDGMAEILLDAGADMNIIDNNGWTALMYATYNGSIKILKILLNRLTEFEKEIEINRAGKTGRTALMSAAQAGYEKVMDILLQFGGNLLRIKINNIDSDGQTALIKSSRAYHKTTANMLLEKGANPNIIDKNENIALTYAVLNKDKKMIKILIDAGSNLTQHIQDLNNSDRGTPIDNEIMINKYFNSIDISSKQRRTNFLNNMTRDTFI